MENCKIYVKGITSKLGDQYYDYLFISDNFIGEIFTNLKIDFSEPWKIRQLGYHMYFDNGGLHLYKFKNFFSYDEFAEI